MSGYSGDFLGFQIGNIHSSQLNITRVSSGDRYSNVLIPTFKDQSIEIPGGDGMYYQNTHYNSRGFQIDFAYDSLTDQEMRRLAQILGDKQIKPLIFDEWPHKKYMVKPAAPPELKFISFGEQEDRIYKGEGTINFVAYYPFGIGVDSVITSSTIAVAGSTSSSYEVNLFNKGDLEADFRVYYDISAISSSSSFDCMIEINDKPFITISSLVQESKDDDILMINSKTHLVEGLSEDYDKNGTLYNKYVTQGEFKNLPVGMVKIVSTQPIQKIEFVPIYY